jgi:hypothetical protein
VKLRLKNTVSRGARLSGAAAIPGSTISRHFSDAGIESARIDLPSYQYHVIVRCGFGTTNKLSDWQQCHRAAVTTTMQPAKVKRMPIAPAIFLLMATFYDSYGPI